MYCVMSKSVWFADMIKSDFIHSQNFSAVEITSEEDSCKENVSEGDFFFSFWLLQNQSMSNNCKSENHL